MPQDVKTSPDGKLIYVADMMADGVHIIRTEPFEVVVSPDRPWGSRPLSESRRASTLLFQP